MMTGNTFGIFIEDLKKFGHGEYGFLYMPKIIRKKMNFSAFWAYSR